MLSVMGFKVLYINNRGLMQSRSKKFALLAKTAAIIAFLSE